MLGLIIVVIIVLLGSGFCSSSEAAIFSVSSTKVQSLVNEGNLSAKALLKVKNNISSSVASVVLLNNLFNIPGTFIAGLVAHDVLIDDWKLAIFTALFTFLIILFGEILPKNFGERFALPYALAVARPLLIIAWLLFPVLWLLDKINLFLFGKRVHSTVSEEEIKVLLEQGIQSKSIEQDEQSIINNVFKMNDKTANDIMTPRVNIYSISQNKTLKAQKKLLFESPHSRIPLYRDDHDDIENYIFLRDALEALSLENGAKKPKEIAIPILKIKEDTRVDSLLVMFQKRREHMALVVDEFGGTSGIVTLEDVLEELVGEIVDETDEVVDMRAKTSS